MKLIELCAFIPRNYLENKTTQQNCTHSILYKTEDSKIKECYECAICGKTFDTSLDEITIFALENRYIINTTPDNYIKWMIHYVIYRISQQYIDEDVIDIPDIMNQIDSEIKTYLKKYNAQKFYDKRINKKLRKVIIR